MHIPAANGLQTPPAAASRAKKINIDAIVLPICPLNIKGVCSCRAQCWYQRTARRRPDFLQRKKYTLARDVAEHRWHFTYVRVVFISCSVKESFCGWKRFSSLVAGQVPVQVRVTAGNDSKRFCCDFWPLYWGCLISTDYRKNHWPYNVPPGRQAVR